VITFFHIAKSSALRPTAKVEDRVSLLMSLQREGGPVTAGGTGFHFRRFLRLAELRWGYSNSSPHGEFEISFGIIRRKLQRLEAENTRNRLQIFSILDEMADFRKQLFKASERPCHSIGG
jgi:hypothetical protein